MTAKPTSEAWSWRHAVTRSGLAPTTRHLLLTLSVFMDAAGRSCFPSIEDLIDATGLGRTAIVKHLASAAESGWLKKTRHGYGGRRWKHAEYIPCWPGRDLEGGSLGELPRDDEAVREADQGGSRGDTEAVREVNRVRDQSIHHSNTSPDDADDARAISASEEQDILDAAGEAIDRTSPNIFVMAVPMRWKACGMDWRLDVLAGIRSAAARAPPGRVRNWEYFSQAIADFNAKRTGPMPSGAPPPRGQKYARRSSAEIARELTAAARQREHERDHGSAGPHLPELPGTRQR